MTHPSIHARTQPDKAAIIMGRSGQRITYRELDALSNRGAHLFRAHGIARGEVVALCLDNHPRFLALAWAAQRAGLYFVCIPARLTATEIAYILRDSGARALVVSEGVGERVAGLPGLFPRLPCWRIGAHLSGYRDWEEDAAQQPATSIPDESAGTDMLYSSGTTGRPKGVRLPLPEDTRIDAPNRIALLAQHVFGVTGHSVYLSPAPLYHAAPLRWCMTVQRLGGTVLVMEHFEPEEALALIERHRVTASQWVPTHFVRMLKLPEAVRTRYDLSSQQLALHAAAPCPVPVKEAMIDWWGPVLTEYYAGSEGNGMTMIGANDWLAHKGSVGRAVVGTIHVCDDAGREVPARTTGLIYFAGGAKFEYHNDPAATAAAKNELGWSTLGDIGWVDDDGFLYITDRKAFTIISGGVNIYPQEIENHLITHPKVADVAVFGAPCPDMGERVIAVVQPVDIDAAGAALAAELIAYCEGTLSRLKIPRHIDFLAQLPREPTGKLYKRLLREQYWKNQEKNPHD